MNRSHQYINTFYLAVHLVINIMVVVLIINLIDMYVPIKHIFMGYHINLHDFYARIDMQKGIALAIAIGAALFYYHKKKVKTDDTSPKL